MDRRPKTINLRDMFNCVATSSQTPNLTVRCVGMEPKEGFQPSARAGVFAEEITLGSDAAGRTVGPLFERIRAMIQVDTQTMFDFSEKVLKFCKSHKHGKASHALLCHAALFARGARTATDCMKRGPTLFITVSRNFESWFLHGCPSPDSISDRSYPSWCSWKGVPYGSNPNVLCTFPEPERVVRRCVVKFGARHWMILLPNPCRWMDGPGKMEQCEQDCVELARQLVWS